MANVTVTLEAGLRAAVTMRTHTIYADEPIEEGGTDTGAMPTELMLGALGACAAITAQLYARRKGWALEGVDVEVSRERFKTDDYPDYDPAKHGAGETLNEIRQRIRFKGDLTDEQRARLLEIAARCPVHRILTDPKAMIDELMAEEQGEQT